MKTIYLHIGTFKTGTSSIQNFITRNREAFCELGYFVPSSQAMGHHELPVSLIRDYSDFNAAWPMFEGNSAQIWGKLIEEIDSCPCDKVIVSAEEFCDLVNENCREVSERMGGLVGNYLAKYKVVVICYVRELLPYMRSMYQEIIKSTPRTLSFEEQIHRWSKSDAIHLFPSIYLDFFEKLFGRDALVVKKYSRDELLGGDVVCDFMATIGLGEEINPLLDAREPGLQELNTSIDVNEIDLKRAFNLAGSHGLALNQKIAALIKGSAALAEGDANGAPAQQAQELSKLINIEQDKLNDRYKVNFAALKNGVFATDSKPRDVDYLYLVALLGLNIQQGRDAIQLGRDAIQLAQQNRETLTRLETQIRFEVQLKRLFSRGLAAVIQLPRKLLQVLRRR